jgi:DNA polymerase IV
VYVNGAATILHADLDSFYASVEQRDDPALQGKPVIVGGGGVVLAASYEAKAFGVRSAMPGSEARRLCPKAIVVPPRMEAYTEASRAVFEVFHDTTPLVEGISIDEAFLEVGGLRRISGEPIDIAIKLRADVKQRVGLPITVGIATTKFLAKVASAHAKPDGLLLVPAGGEMAFLHPLPVQRLWGVGPKTTVKLNARGIFTVGDLAELDEDSVMSMVGLAVGKHLHGLSQNRDLRVVETVRRRSSIGAQHALGRRPRTAEEIDATLVTLVDRVTSRMRDANRIGRSVSVRFRFGDFTTASRSHMLPQATAHTDTILHTTRGLLSAAQSLIDANGLTLIGIAVADLFDADAQQLALPFHAAQTSAIDDTLDRVRKRFGNTAVTRAVHLGRSQGLTMPMLPD